jgi:hypothetical protein
MDVRWVIDIEPLDPEIAAAIPSDDKIPYITPFSGRVEPLVKRSFVTEGDVTNHAPKG